MSESKTCHHRFSMHEEGVGFTNNDGVDIFNAGSRFQKSITCGHSELPVEHNEMIEANQIEKKK